MQKQLKTLQYYKFCLYGFFKNLKFFEPFFLLFFIDKGVNYLHIGTLYAIREISIIILEIPTGVLADILGRRKTMIFSFVGYIASFIIFFFANNFLTLLIGMLLFSFGDAMRTGTHKAMIFDYLKINNWQIHKIDYYGHTRSYSQIGSALSSLIAAAIVIYSGSYKWIFIASTIPYFFDLLLILSYPKILDGPINKSNHTLIERITLFRSELKIALTSKSNWNLFIHLSTFHGLFKATKDYLQPIIILSFSGLLLIPNASNQQSTSILIGIIYFVIYLIASLTSRKAKQITSWFKTPYQALNITLAIGIISLALSSTFISIEYNNIAIIIFIGLFIIQNLRKPVGVSIVSDQIHQEILATGLSVQSLFDALFSAIFAFAIGLLAEVFSIEKALLTIALILLCLMPFIILKNKT